MTEDEFRAAMSRAKAEDRLLFVADDNDFGIAVGYDSGRSVIILHGNGEMPKKLKRGRGPMGLAMEKLLGDHRGAGR